jgi:hypothetical protein
MRVSVLNAVYTTTTYIFRKETPRKEVVDFSETLVYICQPTRRHIPEDGMSYPI